MGRKNHELQAEAIDNVMTTMSQIVLMDRALEFAKDELPSSELALFDAEQRANDLLGIVHDVDIDRRLLANVAASIEPDLQDLPRIMAKELLTKIMGDRREKLVKQQAEQAKPLRWQSLNFLLEANAIMAPIRYLTEREFAKFAAATPKRAGESIRMKGHGRYLLNPSRSTGRAPFYGYIGYSICAIPKDRIPRFVSLVDLDGHPQVTITPH